MHKQRLYSRARALGTIVVALLLQASSPYPGGCGSDVRRSYAYVAPHCDADGVSPAGCVVTEATRSEDGRGSASPACPSSATLDCGTGFCCPEAHAYCCRNQTWCGLNADACEILTGSSQDEDADEYGKL